MDPTEMNFNEQEYTGIKLKLRLRDDYHELRAKAYYVTNPAREGLTMKYRTYWIPNEHLAEDGTIKSGVDIDFVFERSASAQRRRDCGISLKELRRY